MAFPLLHKMKKKTKMKGISKERKVRTLRAINEPTLFLLKTKTSNIPSPLLLTASTKDKLCKTHVKRTCSLLFFSFSNQK